MKRSWTVAHAKPSRNLALTSFTRSRLGQRSEKRILVIEPMQDANQPKISPQTLRDFPLAGASLAGRDASSLKRTSAKLTAEGLRITRPRIAILTAPLAPPILSIARPYRGPRRRRESSDDRALALLYSVRSRARGEKTAWQTQLQHSAPSPTANAARSWVSRWAAAKRSAPASASTISPRRLGTAAPQRSVTSPPAAKPSSTIRLEPTPHSNGSVSAAVGRTRYPPPKCAPPFSDGRPAPLRRVGPRVGGDRAAALPLSPPRCALANSHAQVDGHSPPNCSCPLRSPAVPPCVPSPVPPPSPL